MQLRPFVAKIAYVFMADFLFSPKREQKVDVLLTKLGKLNDVVTKLQANDCNVRKARAYFDSVLEVYHILEKTLKVDARIVQKFFLRRRFLICRTKRRAN